MSAFPAPFEKTPYLLHLGLACFDRAFLAAYCDMPPTPLMVPHPPSLRPPKSSRPQKLALCPGVADLSVQTSYWDGYTADH